MKNFLKPYSKYAKFALSAAAVILVALGIYDEQTVATLIGTASGFGAAFWALYDKYFGDDESE